MNKKVHLIFLLDDYLHIEIFANKTGFEFDRENAELLSKFYNLKQNAWKVLILII
jgi:hypothetical protein